MAYFSYPPDEAELIVPGTEDLNLVGVHGGVGDHNLGVLQSLGLMHTRLLIQKKS